MRRVTLRIAIAVLTFIVGISAAALWIIHRKPANPNQSNPVTESPLSLCDLVQNSEHFNATVMRVQAILIGYHEIALYDPACTSKVKYIRADFDAASRQKLIQAIDALNGAGFQHGNFWASVVLAGRFDKIPDADCRVMVREAGMPNRDYINNCYRLAVTNVEHVEAVAASVAWPE